MARLLIAAAMASSAVLAAIAGLLLPSDQQRASSALFVFARVLGVVVVILLLAAGLRQRSARRRAAAAAPESPLSRLEYLPAVTTRVRLLHWRGDRYLVNLRRTAPDASESPQDAGLAGSAQPPYDATQDVTGSAYPRPASSTRQPQSDTAEASPRAT